MTSYALSAARKLDPERLTLPVLTKIQVNFMPSIRLAAQTLLRKQGMRTAMPSFEGNVPSSCMVCEVRWESFIEHNPGPPDYARVTVKGCEAGVTEFFVSRGCPEFQLRKDLVGKDWQQFIVDV